MKARKLLSLLLTLCMVFSLFAGVSVTASAEETGETTYPITFVYPEPSLVNQVVVKVGSGSNTFVKNGDTINAAPDAKAGDKVVAMFTAATGYIPASATVTKTASGEEVAINVTAAEERRFVFNFVMPDEAVTITCYAAKKPDVTVTVGDASLPRGGNAVVPLSISGISELNVSELRMRLFWGSNDRYGWTVRKEELTKERTDAGVTVENYNNYSMWYVFKAAEGETLKDGQLLNLYLSGGSANDTLQVSDTSSVKLTNTSGASVVYALVKEGGNLTCDANRPYTITINPGEHGTVKATVGGEEVTEAAMNTEVVFETVTADEGYALAELQYTREWTGGKAQTSTNGKIKMPGDNITVTPVFLSSRKLTVDESKNVHGSITFPQTEYLAGRYPSGTVTADEGYQFSELHYSYTDPATGETVEQSTTGNIFTMPDADVTVWVVCAKPYSITTVSSAGGTISTANTTVLAGREVTVNVTPDANFALVSLKYKLNGAEDKPENWVDIPADSTGVTTYWRFRMPEGDITIRAEFLAYPTIEIMPTEHGELKMSDTGPVRANQPLGAYAFPEDGYYLSALYYTVDDGEPVSFAEKLVTPDTGAVKVYAVFSSDESSAVSIGSVAELLAYAETANADPLTTIGSVVKLTADIDLSSVEWPSIESFYGLFDGNGHTVTLGGSKGLFGTVKHAVVRNVSLNGTITSAELYTPAAPLAKNVYNSTIKNCTNEAEVNGTYASGMVGYLEFGAKLVGCHNYGAVNATDCGRNGGASGLVNRASGYTYYELPAVEITDCGNYGSIFAHNGDAAGILYNAYASVNISGCRNSGSITTEVSDLPENADWLGTLAAGILARASSISQCTINITNCYNTGNIKADSVGTKQDSVPSAAGIVTFNNEAKSMANNKGVVTVTNCYNSGTLTKSGQDADHGDTTTIGKGEIATEEVYTGNNYSGFVKTSVASLGILVQNNCYTKDNATAAALGDAYKDDANGVNKGNTPLLKWESEEVDDTPRAVTFEVVGPATYELTVSANADLSDPMTAEADGTYLARPGTYYYRVAAEGYVIYKGSFSVVRSAPTVRVEMQKGVEVRFALSPADASLVLSDGRNEIEIFEVSAGVYRATLIEGALYNYSVSASGYNSTQREFTAKAGTVSITLTASSRPVEVQYIYGDGNEGQAHTVSAGGTYYIGDGATGVLTISTTEPVTLIGAGTALSSAYEDLYIKCSVAGVKLTLQDVGIHNTRGKGDPKMTNMINFRGRGNELSFAGISVLDQDTGATGYAMIHVPDGAELTVSGGTAYIYKREQGAGIGGNGGAKGGEGQAAETNGTIIIRDAELFFKNTKQGACIGAGANAGTQAPGDIRIENSRLNLIANSRAAAIGGAAGNVGASSGTNVYVDAESTVSINVDWSGSAIGGGGFDAGNDADGGKLIYSGGSIRAFIDFNAIGNWGVESAGVHGNKAVTADVVNAAGDALYLLVLNTSGVGGSEFTVKEGSELIYSGTTHQWAFVNEKLEKQDQVDVKYTIDNWVELVDSNLYLYLTGEDHTLTVNGTEFAAKWDAESESFTVTNLSSGETVTPGKADGELPFTDVDGHWAIDAIRYAYENKLFQGVSDTEFAPNTAMTRGMLVTVLYRLEGEPAVTANADFTDVDADQWYAKAVAWAAENEIVKGYGETFGPNDLVTREQMATILLRYAVWKQYDTTAGGMALREYADYAEISGWATAALEWANAEGLILGRTETTIVPQGDATRAEVATILMRFIEKFAK